MKESGNDHNRQHMATPATYLRYLWPVWSPYAPHRQHLWPLWPVWPQPRRGIWVFAAPPVNSPSRRGVSLTAKGLSAPNLTKEDGSLPPRLTEMNTIASFASGASVTSCGAGNAVRSQNRDPRLRNPAPVQIQHHTVRVPARDVVRFPRAGLSAYARALRRPVHRK